jgi:diaminohydroxyphosphoribosylaminopyrimidine deaminase/5-amino-6-(5-phosphoribosylamino)uracil reductase
MRRAIELAWRGDYTTKPNPLVGCVISDNNSIVAEGWHQRAGQPHAERIALAQAAEQKINVQGLTAYVTLEPCSHFGRTSPCADALIDSGIGRCVVAMQDPNPCVSGQGIERMRQAGIKVEVGLLAAEARQLNPSFLYAMAHQRPYVTLKTAASLDGRTAMQNGESQWITGSESRQEVHRLRAKNQAILTGVGTVQADDPSLNVRLNPTECQALNLSQEDCLPLTVILDTDLKMSSEAKILQQGSSVIFCSETALKANTKRFPNQVEIIAAPVEPNQGLNLSFVLNWVSQYKDIQRIMIEAGAGLSASFVKQGLVNELHVFLAPVIMGSEARAMFDLPEIRNMSDKIEYKIDSIAQFGQDVRLILKP